MSQTVTISVLTLYSSMNMVELINHTYIHMHYSYLIPHFYILICLKKKKKELLLIHKFHYFLVKKRLSNPSVHIKYTLLLFVIAPEV